MFEFVIAVIAILVALKIVSNMRKKTADAVIAPVTKVQENKPTVKPVVAAEPKAPAIEPEAKVAVTAASPVAVAISSADDLPQDSTLRRHFITQLRATIVALKPARPTDSTLSRHYDALINAEVEQCNSNAAIECLQSRYDAHKKTAAQTVVQPAKVVAAPVVESAPIVSSVAPALPEDSMLRRHAITHLDSLSD